LQTVGNPPGTGLSPMFQVQTVTLVFGLDYERKWQGQQDLNPRPTVLETVALPTELYPYAGARVSSPDACIRFLPPPTITCATEMSPPPTKLTTAPVILPILERVKGIEPSSSAWKAVALPLSYTRTKDGGGGRTRTYEGIRQRIYSPPPLPLGTLPHPVRRSGSIRSQAPDRGRFMATAPGSVNDRRTLILSPAPIACPDAVFFTPPVLCQAPRQRL
jgi:hypothetical protein